MSRLSYKAASCKRSPSGVAIGSPARRGHLPSGVASFALAALILLLSGCAAVKQPPNLLPGENLLTLQQLRIHSNFDVPAHHRLVEELDAQRVEVSNRLALPVSDEPIEVYLFEDEDRFNRYLTERFPSFPSRRAFFLETDTRLTVYAHWGDRVAEDLRHEVCHGYLHSMCPKLPLWLDEGIAEYFEVPRGERGLNVPHVTELARLSAEGQWRPDLRRLESLRSPGDMTQVDYAESWAWVHLLLETTPPRRRQLQGYLASVKATGQDDPLSLWLRPLDENLEKSLVEHLASLKTAPPSDAG